MIGIIEGLLYIQGDLGVTIKDVCDVLDIDESNAKELIYELKNNYEQEQRGLRINFLGNTFKMTTKEEHKEYYRKLAFNDASKPLSSQALEVLAIIAYNEPITRLDIDSLRGVDSAYIVRRLVAKGLIKECGKKDAPGKPTLYKTTDEFLDYFGLSNIEQLPKIEIKEEKEEKENRDLFTSIYKEN